MNILLVSNNDMCRSRMAQKILSSFGHGIRIFTSGVLPGRVIPSSVVGVMEQNGYDCSRKKASDVDIYCHQPWDYVITLCEEAKEVEGDFNKEVKNWKHFSFDDPFQHVYGDETELEYRISELYETMYCELYEFYRDELSEPVVSHRCLGILTHPLGLKVIPSFSNNSFCFCQPGTSLPWLFTTRWQGRCCSSGA